MMGYFIHMFINRKTGPRYSKIRLLNTFAEALNEWVNFTCEDKSIERAVLASLAIDSCSMSIETLNLELLKLPDHLLNRITLYKYNVSENIIPCLIKPDLFLIKSMFTTVCDETECLECPICMNFDTSLKTNCCNQFICSTCFKRITRIHNCPFCRRTCTIKSKLTKYDLSENKAIEIRRKLYTINNNYKS